MHVAIAGGSGFVGKTLVNTLKNAGHEVTVLTRSAEKARQPGYAQWLQEGARPEEKLGKVDAFVNLAGESINGLRWTEEKKRRIMESRMAATGEIIRIIKEMQEKPRVLVNASAVGYYGMSETETFTEESKSSADDFLATVVKKWEGEAALAQSFGVRTVFARFGIVLGKGGALPLMALPYKFGAGGTMGTGRQWISWVHVEDVAGLIRFAIEQPELKGPLNVTAPEPVRMKAFGQTIGKVLNRPHWLPVPAPLVTLMLGEMSGMLVKGQRAIPQKAVESGYTYKYGKLQEALKASLT